MEIPDLEMNSKRKSYYNKYSDKAYSIIKAFLIDKKSYRVIDSEILGLNSKKTRGYESMNFLRYFGINDGHVRQNINNISSMDQFIEGLKEKKDDKYDTLISILENNSNTDDFITYLLNKGYYYDKEIIEDYLLSLKVKPFVIFTGNSGTGKTKLLQLCAEYIQENIIIKIIIV